MESSTRSRNALLETPIAFLRCWKPSWNKTNQPNTEARNPQKRASGVKLHYCTILSCGMMSSHQVLTKIITPYKSQMLNDLRRKWRNSTQTRVYAQRECTFELLPKFWPNQKADEGTAKQLNWSTVKKGVQNINVHMATVLCQQCYAMYFWSALYRPAREYKGLAWATYDAAYHQQAVVIAFSANSKGYTATQGNHHWVSALQ